MKIYTASIYMAHPFDRDIILIIKQFEPFTLKKKISKRFFLFFLELLPFAYFGIENLQSCYLENYYS